MLPCPFCQNNCDFKPTKDLNTLYFHCHACKTTLFLPAQNRENFWVNVELLVHLARENDLIRLLDPYPYQTHEILFNFYACIACSDKQTRARRCKGKKAANIYIYCFRCTARGFIPASKIPCLELL